MYKNTKIMENIKHLLDKYREAVSKRAVLQTKIDELLLKKTEEDNNVLQIEKLIEALIPERKPIESIYQKERQMVRHVERQLEESLFKNESSYDPKVAMIKKIIYVLDKLHKPLTAREITNSINGLEENLTDTRKLMSRVAGTLNIKTGKDVVRNKEHESEEWKYSLIQW